MKIIATSILILLGISIYAQQNYFSNRYTFGCGQNGQKIIQNGNNYDGISSVACLGLRLKSVFFRIDSTGNVLLKKIHGVDSHNYISGGFAGLIKLEDSSYIYAGSIDDTTYKPDLLLYKLSKDGDSIWIKQYGDSLFQSGWQCRISRDGGIIIAGQTGIYNPLYNDDVLLMKTDSNGIEQWQRHYGGTGYEIGLAIDTCLDGGFIITGYTNSFGIGAGSQFGNSWIIKTDSHGNVSWTKTFGDIYDDAFWNGITCHDGSFAFAGYVTIFDPFYPTTCCAGPQQLNVIKLDSAGNTIFEKTYGRQMDGNQLYSIKELQNGDLITAGWYWDTLIHHHRGVILKINSQGDSLWLHTYEYLHGQYSDSYLYDIAPTHDGGFIATGFVVPVLPDTGTQDTWVLKVDSNGCEVSNCIFTSTGEIQYSKENEINFFPNPSSGIFYIKNTRFDEIEKTELFNYSGQLIFFREGKISSIDLRSQANGIYFYRVVSKERKIAEGRLMKVD